MNVISRRGGKVHRPHPSNDHFPWCRTGSQMNGGTRYTTTAQAVTCTHCQKAAVPDPEPTAASSQPASPGATARKVIARYAHPTEPPRPPATKPGARKPKKNGVAEDQAARQADKIMQELIEKIIARRGIDDVGEGDQWAGERREGVDDYTYDLAVEVRKLREAGEAWWRIAYDLGLPHSGPSAKQGKGGAAYARRLWARAWGPVSQSTRAQRVTKAQHRERVAVEEHRPAFSTETPDNYIVDTVCGKEIHWTGRIPTANGTVIAPLTAYVHHDPRTIKIVLGPRGRVVEFFEALDADHLKVDPRMAIAKTGPRRSVYVHNIWKVGQ
jgi:hypothetical protein